MKIIAAIGMIVLMSLTACSDNTMAESDWQKQQTAISVPADIIMLQAGAQTFVIKLDNGKAARELAARLPLTISMSELHGNEKYYYLDQSLTAASEAVGTIRSGDFMLYGSDCLVLFYQDFSTSYSYTRLGQVDWPDGLAEALGSGSVEVTFRQPGPDDVIDPIKDQE